MLTWVTYFGPCRGKVALRQEERGGFAKLVAGLSLIMLVSVLLVGVARE